MLARCRHNRKCAVPAQETRVSCAITATTTNASHDPGFPAGVDDLGRAPDVIPDDGGNVAGKEYTDVVMPSFMSQDVRVNVSSDLFFLGLSSSDGDSRVGVVGLLGNAEH